MILKVGRRLTAEVSTTAEAQTRYSSARDASGEGASTFPMGVLIGHTCGKVVKVSYNARLWLTVGAVPFEGGPRMTAKTFGQLADGWQFCGFRILRDKWERMAVHASSLRMGSDDVGWRGLMARIEEKLRDETRKEMSGVAGVTVDDVSSIVLQTAGEHYAGPLMFGRFQVMASWLPGSFYLVDHTIDDLLVRESTPGSNVKRFGTVAAAEDHAYSLSKGPLFTGVLGGGIRPGPVESTVGTTTRQEGQMAKPAVKKAAKKGAARVPASTRAPAAPRKETPPPPKAKSEGRKPTPGSVTVEMIKAGDSDEAIVSALKKQFPDAANAIKNVGWYRSDLKRKGVVVETKAEAALKGTAASGKTPKGKKAT